MNKDAKDFPSCWTKSPPPRPFRHPNTGMSSMIQHSASSIAFLSRMGASTRGIVLGSPHSSVRLHTSVWPQSPPLRWGSPDSSKQRLKGFCATAETVLPGQLSHVLWWVKFLRACSRQCRNNLHIDSTYLQTYRERQCAEYTYIYSVHTVYYLRHTYTYQYTLCTICTHFTLCTHIYTI